MSGQNLGKIERGKVQYGQLLLEKIAIELNCSPWDLIRRAPETAKDIVDLVESLPEESRADVRRYIEFVASKTGTDG